MLFNKINGRLAVGAVAVCMGFFPHGAAADDGSADTDRFPDVTVGKCMNAKDVSQENTWLQQRLKVLKKKYSTPAPNETAEQTAKRKAKLAVVEGLYKENGQFKDKDDEAAFWERFNEFIAVLGKISGRSQDR